MEKSAGSENNYEVVRSENNDIEGNQPGVEMVEKNEAAEEKKEIPSLKPTIFHRLYQLFTTVDEEEMNVPAMSFWTIFLTFLWFGCRAFGGPMAQIAMMKTELVIEKKWISEKRFNRVYAMYQVLPGPEATELACYFGYLAGGRFGGFLGGLGFVLPGFCGMLLWSYVYVTYGLTDGTVQASFRCIQCAVAAIIFRSTFKLAEGSFKDHTTKAWCWDKFYIFLWTFLTSVIGLNFFIALGVSGIMNTVSVREEVPKQYRSAVCVFISCVTVGFFILYCELNGRPTGSLIGGNIGGSGTTYESLFELGLIAGMVTFGGAYTTLPFIYTSAVTGGSHWLTQQQFLDAIAITNMMPTPLVTFVCLIGYIGHGIGGAFLMTIGIFIPAFSFTIIGHNFFMFFVDNKFIEPFLDGIAASVIGLLCLTAFQFVHAAVNSGIDAVVFFLAFQAAFYFTDKYTQPIILIAAAIAGQALYTQNV